MHPRFEKANTSSHVGFRGWFCRVQIRVEQKATMATKMVAADHASVAPPADDTRRLAGGQAVAGG